MRVLSKLFEQLSYEMTSELQMNLGDSDRVDFAMNLNSSYIIVGITTALYILYEELVIMSDMRGQTENMVSLDKIEFIRKVFSVKNLGHPV